MCPASLPPAILVDDEKTLGLFVRALARCPLVAVDTESNSLHAYRERVCLIQFSTPEADYILDPIQVPDLSPLAPFFANPIQQKIFHAAEYDIICLKRDFNFEFKNLFDTMSAARTLGWPRVGLASILETHFGVRLNKRYQHSNWGRRPLAPEQLAYAQLDTHYLLALRDTQLHALTETGRWPEANEDFSLLEQVSGNSKTGEGPDPPAFWRVKGAFDLTPAQAAVLRSLFEYREAQAERMDRPPFKVMGEATLMNLARQAPARIDELHDRCGMTPRQIQRFGKGVLRAILRGLRARPQQAPQTNPVPQEVQERYERLHTWRKKRARERGVESDVIISGKLLKRLARRAPLTQGELARVPDFGPWRRKTYGEEILAALRADPDPGLGRSPERSQPS